MKCCKPNRNLFNPLAIPPDFNPAESTPLYLYALSATSFLQTTDRYYSLTVDGTTYSSVPGGTIMPDYIGGTLGNVFQDDLALAGLTTGGNGGRASGYTPDVNLYGDQYVFFIVSTQPHTISVSLEINGATQSYSLNGGLFAYTNYCMTVTTADPTTEQILFLLASIVDKTSINTNGITYDVTGVTIDDPAGLETEINTRLNTVNTLLDYNVGYVDNGDGTVTVTMQIPHVDCDPPNGVYALDLRRIETTSGRQNNNPC